MDPQAKKQSSSLQLILFTLFLFLLVAIPYTIYLSSSKPKAVTPLTTIPSKSTTQAAPSITPPAATTTTTCIQVPSNYPAPAASPSAYFFQDNVHQLCYPPTLPPFPFTWQTYNNYQNGYTIDTPSNWLDKSTTVKKTLVHIFSSDDATASKSATSTVSFAWYAGQDPYASQSSYLKNPITRSGKTGAVYTGGSDFVAAIFPMQEGYFLLQSSRMDSAFYAFEHMLDSLVFK